MKRRAYLARIAAIASVGSVAGCLQSRGAPDPDDTSPPDTPTPSGTSTETRTATDASTASGPRTAADARTPVDTRSLTATPHPTETPGDGTPTDTPPERTSTPPEWTPTEAPPGVSASFSAADGTCGGLDGSASVAFGRGSVVVDGTLVTPVPCYSATLRRVTVEEGVLEIRIAEVPPPEGTVCVECIGSVSYTATIRPGGTTIERVRVVHVGRGTAETVAVAERH